MQATIQDHLLKDHFLGWQCRIRQLAIRNADGQPSTGMRPLVTIDDEIGPIAQITVLINKRSPEEFTAQFRHMVKKTNDPAERFDGVVKLLSAAYYQKAREFSDELTGLFGPDSTLVRKLLANARCKLAFEQYNQRYLLDCDVRLLGENELGYQATFWHNSLFNPSLPGGVQILGFAPRWSASLADPPIA